MTCQRLMPPAPTPPPHSVISCGDGMSPRHPFPPVVSVMRVRETVDGGGRSLRGTISCPLCCSNENIGPPPLHPSLSIFIHHPAVNVVQI